MSREEVRRAGVLDRAKAGRLKLVSVAEMLELSYRQVKRIWKRYQQEGIRGLVHGSAGRPSNRTKPPKFRERVLELVREKYGGEPNERFGPTLAAEHLAEEDGLEVDGETLRRWMLQAGLWSRRRKRKQHRRRRERRKHFGELVQLDGSPHAWFEDRGWGCCLVDMVDDATGTVFGLFSDQETTWASADVLRAWIELHGVPQALYVDRDSVYVHTPSEAEKLRGEAAETQFGRMCRQLGIRIITANSPQAKGRIERGHGTHQDRLIKKLRLKRIGNQQEANRYLREHYWADHNRRFARTAAEPEDYHVKAPSKRELDAIFRLEYERVISNDWVVRYEGRWLQIQRESRYAPAGSRVTVSVGGQGDLKVSYRGRPVVWEEIPAPLPRKLDRPAKAEPIEIRKTPTAAAVEHPWKKYAYQTMREPPIWVAR
jgi:transposase/head-tail adaptor